MKESYDQPGIKKNATIETAYGGKKIVYSKDTEEKFLAFNTEELEYEKLILEKFKQDEVFNNISINTKLWIEQRVNVINKFMSGEM